MNRSVLFISRGSLQIKGLLADVTRRERYAHRKQPPGSDHQIAQETDAQNGVRRKVCKRPLKPRTDKEEGMYNIAHFRITESFA
jgi:hypothetical protein